MKSILLRTSIALILALVALVGVWGLLGLVGLSQAQGSAPEVVALANQILYVDHDAPGPAHDGLSWTTAYTQLQTALALAIPGDEIWVAEGVYTPTATFQLKNGVALYGGFVATETLRTQRDWQTHVTVLSGDLDGDDATDPHGVVTTTANIVGANAWNVVTGGGVTESAVLDGFVVTAGQATGDGGGMYNVLSDPMLTNVTFSGNSASGSGGGMYNVLSDPTLTDVTFSGNYAIGGGGMFNDDSNPMLTDVTFSSNSADYGGGMYNVRSDPTLTDVTFSSNSATSDGGGMFNAVSDPTLTDVTFSGNSADYCGGGMYNEESAPTLTNVTFSSNSTTYGGYRYGGGGMYNEESAPTLTDVTFSSNFAGDFGGGMYNDNSDPTLTNVTFSGNSAADYGGGMYNFVLSDPMLTNVTFSGNYASSGGGMCNEQSDPTLTNVTFSGNSAADYGGGMYNLGSRPTLTNCILWGNTAGTSGPQIRNLGSTPAIAYSDVQDSGGSGTGWDSSLGTDGGHNIDADPLFVRNPDPGDGDWTTLDDNDYGDLRLQFGSPAIDAGDDSAVSGLATDLAGNPRIIGPHVDMGAYEALMPVYLPLVLRNY